jgi:hypothetical protein
MMTQGTLLVLGAGYTGKACVELAITRDRTVMWTSRSPSPGGIVFDFNDRSTWGHLPPRGIHALITFPLVPESHAVELFEFLKPRFSRIAAIGTTSSFKVAQPNEEITEESAVADDERTKSEQALLDRGLILVRAAGIYGPHRDPRRWLQKGMIGDFSRFVNFIHRDDLAQICLKALEVGEPGRVYLASDGHPCLWKDLAHEWGGTEGSDGSKRASKKIQPARSLRELGITLKYKSVLEGVRALDVAS